ncbi:MAG: DUF3823 domain-containing protein [Tannerellaceae bacterium]|jgi:hypothetical protein|nr:DUF3823 domain-containing protein [Tannerellaceae bacterium]
MKRLYINSILLPVLSLICVSCLNELDNYDAPNGGIKGQILDAVTNEPIPLPVQGSAGTIINMYEQNTEATKSIDFYAKHDGTYENSRVFNCDYKIVVKGPFTSPCEGSVTVKGQTGYNLTATPYARIKTEVSASGTKVSIQYSVEKSDPSFTVSEVYGYWNFAPGVDNSTANLAGKITVENTEGIITFDLSEDNAFKDNIYKIKSNGNKIYLRVGAKTEGVINYSEIQTVFIN